MEVLEEWLGTLLMKGRIVGLDYDNSEHINATRTLTQSGVADRDGVSYLVVSKSLKEHFAKEACGSSMQKKIVALHAWLLKEDVKEIKSKETVLNICKKFGA